VAPSMPPSTLPPQPPVVLSMPPSTLPPQPPVVLSTPQPPPPPPPKIKCKFFEAGQCKNGERCRFEHSKAFGIPVPQLEIQGTVIQGTVLSWNSDRKFGFIKPEDGGEDVYCGSFEITDGNALNKGACVRFVRVRKHDGLYVAKQVTGGYKSDGGGKGSGGYGGGTDACAVREHALPSLPPTCSSLPPMPTRPSSSCAAADFGPKRGLASSLRSRRRRGRLRLDDRLRAALRAAPGASRHDRGEPRARFSSRKRGGSTGGERLNRRGLNRRCTRSPRGCALLLRARDAPKCLPGGRDYGGIHRWSMSDGCICC
jgi:cold shock CspA family protein